MTHRHLGRAIVMLLSVLFAGLVLSACGSTKNDASTGAAPAATPTTTGAAPASSPPSSTNAAPAAGGELPTGLSLVSMPKQLGNPYEEIEHNGVKLAAGELGADHRVVGPTDAGAASQVPLLRSIIQQSPDAIIIAANDENAVAPVLKQAMSRDIAVVTMDSDAAKDARTIFVNQAKSEEIGRSQVQIIAKQINFQGPIAILSATPNATNQNAWIRFMKDELTKPEYAKMELVTVAYGDDDDQKSFQETQGLLQAYPNLKGIISPTTVGIAAAARFLSTSPQKGKVKLTGLGTPNQMRKFVKDGTVDVFALWSPEDVGYLAAYAAANLAAKNITGAQGETFDAGKLGPRTIGADGEVVLGPPTQFTKENIDDFDF